MEFLETIPLPSLIILTEGIISLAVGILIFFREKFGRVNFFFFLLAFNIAIWSILLGIFEGLPPGVAEQIFLMLLYVAAAVLPLSVLFFALSLSLDVVTFSRRQAFLLAIPMLLSVIIILLPGFVSTPFDIVSVEGGGWAKQIVFGEWILGFAFYCILYIIASLVILARAVAFSAGVFRSELHTAFFTIAAGSLFMVFANLLLPFFGIFDLSWVGPTVGLVALCSIGYAIAKYRFSDTKLIVLEFISVVVTLILFFDLFVSQSLLNLIVKVAVFLLVVYLSVLLIRSVREEYARKDKVELLASKLMLVNKKLHELDKQKSEFVATAAHHLRDPLTAIKGYAALILEGSFGAISESVRGAVTRILESSNRLVVIVDDFMNISKIESGEMQYDFGSVDIKKMLIDIVDELKLSAENKGLSLSLDIDNPNEVYTTYGDEGKLRQVVSNLVDNAIKYTTGGSVQVRLSKKKTGDGTHILIEVADTGIGMSERTRKKIFHKFSRANEASKFHTGGSGLGLYVAREMLKEHKGRIWAESEGLGKGSTFFVELISSENQEK